VLLEHKRAAGAAILDLTESNPTRAGFEYPAGEIRAALADPRLLVYDPKPAGSMEARAAVARIHGVDPERVLLTASTSEAYAYLFKLLANPGDEVLAPHPSYPLFDFLAALECVSLRHYPLVYHNRWSLDFEGLRRAITGRTRAVVLVNPNNPTGSFLKTDELSELTRICAERRLAIISDEVFADFAFVEDPRRVRTLAGVEDVSTFCLSGLSKIAGLPQVKLGWIIAGGPKADVAFRNLELIADTYLSVSTQVQHAAAGLLKLARGMHRQMDMRVRANLEHLRGALGGDSPASVLHVEGGWYAILRVPRIRGEEEWCLRLLERYDILVQPGYFYDFDREAFLVLSLLTQADSFREGTRRLTEALHE
jgi:aspartate/methionine/tyrosine aminotransferase